MVMNQYHVDDESRFNLNCRLWATHSECNGRVYSLTLEAGMDCACYCHSAPKPNTPSALDPMIDTGQNTE